MDAATSSGQPAAGPSHSIEAGMFVRHHPSTSDEEGTLLLLHGLGAWGRCFDAVVDRPELSRWSKLVPDLPGYGKSPWPAAPESLDQLVERLVEWLGGRATAPLSVVGHSMGGVVAQMLAERWPDGVRCVVDVEGNVCSTDCTLSGKVAGQPEAVFAERGLRDLAAAIYQLGHDEPALRDYYVSLCMCDPRTFHAHSLELIALSDEGRLAERLAALSMPAWFIAGSPEGMSRGALELLSAAGVPTVTIEPAGHVPFVEQPDAFAQALASMIEPGDSS